MTRIRRAHPGPLPLLSVMFAAALAIPACDASDNDDVVVHLESALSTASSSIGNSSLVLYAFGPRTSVATNCWQGTSSATPQALSGSNPPCPWVAETGTTGQWLTPYPAIPISATPTLAQYDALRTSLLGRYVTDPDPATMRGGGDRNPTTPAFDATGPELTMCGAEQVIHNRRDGTPVAQVFRLGDAVVFPRTIFNQDAGTVALWVKVGRPPGAWDWLNPVITYFALENGDAFYKPFGWASEAMFRTPAPDAVGAPLAHDNRWHHVVLSWTGDQATVYADGTYSTTQRATRATWLSNPASFPYGLFGRVTGCTSGVAPCDQIFMKDAIVLNRTINDAEALQLCANGRAGIVAAPVPRTVTARLTGAVRTVSAQSVCDTSRVSQRKLDATLEIRGAGRAEFSATTTGTLWTGVVQVERLVGTAWSAVAGCAINVTGSAFSEHLSVPTSCVLDATSTYRVNLTRLTSARGTNWLFLGGASAPFVSHFPWLDGALGTFGAPDTDFPLAACDRTATPPEPWLPIERSNPLYGVTVATTDPIGLGRRTYQWSTPNDMAPKLFPQRITTTTRAPGFQEYGVQEDVLAAPIQLIANGTPAMLLNVAWNMSPSDPGADRMVLSIDGKAAGVAVHIDTTIDYDGQIWNKLTIPSGATNLTSLSLSLDLNPALVTHLHMTVPVGTAGSATNPYYTHTSGELASIVGTGTTRSAWGQQPLVWLGAPRGGVQVTTSDTASWYGPRTSQIAITRTTAGAINLSLNLLQERPPVDQLTYQIGILATPVRAYASGSRDRQLRIGGGRNIDGGNPTTASLGAWNPWDRLFMMDWNRTSHWGNPRWGYLRSTDYTYRDLATRGACRTGSYSATFAGTSNCRWITARDGIYATDLATYAAVPTAVEAITNDRNVNWNDLALQPQTNRSQFFYWDIGQLWGGDPALEVAGPEWDARPTATAGESTEYPAATHVAASENDFALSEAARTLTEKLPAALAPMTGYHDTAPIVNTPMYDLIGGYYLDVTTPFHSSRTDGERVVDNWTVQGTRDLLKRFYQLNAKLPHAESRTIVNHTSDGSNASNLGFAHMNVTGEHQFAGYHFCSGASVRDSYHNLLTPERLRAEFTGRRIGTETAFLPEFATSLTADPACQSYLAPYASGRPAYADWISSNGRANAPSDSYLYAEHLAGLLLAHDIAVWNINNNPFPNMRLATVLERFGWTDDVSFIGYWENSAAWTPFFTWTASGATIPASGIEDKSRRFISLFGHTRGADCKRKVLAVVMNDTAETATFTNIRFDWAALGYNAPTAVATDPYHAPTAAFRSFWLPGGVLETTFAAPTGTVASGYQVTVAPWNFRVLQFETTAAKCF